MEVVQLALVWRVARQSLGLPDIDPFAAAAQAQPPQRQQQVQPPPLQQVPTSNTKKVKASTVIDQTDETEA